MMARYKDRAARMSRTQIQQDAFDEEHQKRCEAEAEAQAHAKACEALQEALDEAEEEHLALYQRNMAAVVRAAQPCRHAEKSTQVAPAAAAPPPLIEAADAAYATGLQHERDALFSLLREAEERGASLQAYADALEDRLAQEPRDGSVEEVPHDTDEYIYLQLAERSAALDAQWHDVQRQHAEERCTWLETQLAQRDTSHAHMLAALRDYAKVKGNERTSVLEAELATSVAREAALQKQLDHTAQELHRVAWYEEAYAQRSRQADLLADLATVDGHSASIQQSQALQTRMAGLQDTLQALQDQRDRLEACTKATQAASLSDT